MHPLHGVEFSRAIIVGCGHIMGYFLIRPRYSPHCKPFSKTFKPFTSNQDKSGHSPRMPRLRAPAACRGFSGRSRVGRGRYQPLPPLEPGGRHFGAPGSSQELQATLPHTFSTGHVAASRLLW